MFERAVQLWRETFPKREQKLMKIKYVAAIEEFNEYFPGYAEMNDKNYTRLKRYVKILNPLYHCIPWYKWAFSSAFVLENSIDVYLERNEHCQRDGLTGEWAIQIFANHNDHIIEQYREYKRNRLRKWAETYKERRDKADDIVSKTEFRLKWLLGREGYYEYNKARVKYFEKEQRLTGAALAQKKEAQKNMSSESEVQTS